MNKHHDQAAEFGLDLVENEKPLTSDQHVEGLIEEWAGIHSPEAEKKITEMTNKMAEASPKDPADPLVEEMNYAVAEDAASMDQQNSEDLFREDFEKEVPDDMKTEVIEKLMKDGSKTSKELIEHLFNFGSLENIDDKTLDAVSKILELKN